MRRYYLKKDDQSSAGGVVLEGEETCMHYGTAMTYLGAKVYCHTCKTVGLIVGQGPRLSDTMMGKEAALDGDVCICKCDPPPVMIASQNDSFQELDSPALNPLHTAAQSHKASKAQSPQRRYSQRVFVWDSATGEPLKSQRFIADAEGVQQFGRTDQEGYATIETDIPKSFRIHIVFVSPKRDLTPSPGA
jgi:uncharacterized Zn-binding protein involved in type VI secretion